MSDWSLTCDDCRFEWLDYGPPDPPCPECGSRFIYAENTATGALYDSPMMQARRGVGAFSASGKEGA
jgi:hypothetical protein